MKVLTKSSYENEDLKEAYCVLSSLLRKCEKAYEKLAEGTAQHTLMKNRLKALQIALVLIDDEALLALAEEREKNDSGITFSAEEVFTKDGLTLADLDEIPMEYGVDFE